MLTGTTVTLATVAQSLPTSELFITSFEVRALVVDPGVEYPDVESLFNPATGVPPGFARSLVDVAIDFQPFSLTIDFDNATQTRFASGHQNTYVFTFEAAAALRLSGALINRTVTTLGLEDADITVDGNRLSVNVEGLSFNRSTFVRIDLLSDLQGTAQSDRLFGTTGADLVSGGAANDLLSGREGNDTLTGDEGDDTLDGGAGADTLNGGLGDDFLFGGSSVADLRDVIFGGDGQDSLDGGYGNDDLNGGNGHDTVLGDFGADTLIGNDGNDLLAGGAGSDLMFGNAGNDTLNGGFGYDRMNGGTGADSFYHQGVAGHASDWVQDYTAAEGDVLTVGIAGATRAQFQINTTFTAGAGDAGVAEAFIIYRPTGQILWALVDGADDAVINANIGGAIFDLMA